MSKQKQSRQQKRRADRKARKKGIRPTSNKLSFWKKPIVIVPLVLLALVGLFYTNQSQKRSTTSLVTHHQNPNPLITPTHLSPQSPLPPGAKIKRQGRWVMAKDLQPGDSIWYKGKWTVVKRTERIDTLLPEDPTLPIMDYFTDANHLQQVFAFVPIPLSKYTAKEIEVQKSFNEGADWLMSYATIPDSVYAQYDNLKLPPNQRNIDFDEITPWTWKWVFMKMAEEDGDSITIQLRRPHWWMSQHKIKGIGSKVSLSLPEQGIGGVATVVFIRPSQIDTRLRKDRNQLGRVARPLTGWFERTSNNTWDYTFSSGETIGATPEHPFYSEDRKAYIPIGEVKMNEKIKTSQGQQVRLISAKKRHKGKEKVYNVEVYRTHNFYAGESKLLVHNSYIVPRKAKDGTLYLDFQTPEGKVFEDVGNAMVLPDQTGKNVLLLDFNINKIPVEHRPAKGLGTKMFEESWKHFKNKVDEIEGSWVTDPKSYPITPQNPTGKSTNLLVFDKKFKELLAGRSPKSLSEQELQVLHKQAIFETPTGKMVKRITGFQNIDFSPKKFIVDWENLSNTKAKRFTIRFIK